MNCVEMLLLIMHLIFIKIVLQFTLLALLWPVCVHVVLYLNMLK